MANIKSFPNNQDVYIGAEDVMKWLHGRTSGVFAAANNASVSALVNSAMAVTVSDGLGWMANANKDGVVWWIDNEAVNGSKLQLNIDPADGVLNRIDRIIVEWKTTNYVAYPEVKVLKGTSSSKATAPALTNNSTVRQISLAKISVAAGTTSITASMITDERLNASVCGLVTESISIDTSTIQKQFEELLTVIQTELKDLNDDTAALMKAGGTMYGALDMGGNKIQRVATPENETDAVNRKFLDDTLANFESGVSMELLWENDSPKSEFAGRKIYLNLDGYCGIKVILSSDSSNNYRSPSAELYEPSKTTQSLCRDGAYIYSRNMKYEINASGDYVDFIDAYKLNYGNNNVLDNKYMIPYRIYGIKGVS